MCMGTMGNSVCVARDNSERLFNSRSYLLLFFHILDSEEGCCMLGILTIITINVSTFLVGNI